jgi:amino acid transporter
VPRALVSTCVCSAIFGIIYLLTLLFALPDVTQFMTDQSEKRKTVNLAIIVFNEFISYGAALTLAILLLVNVHLAGFASVTVASRIT